jgi:hypothetical protein
MLGDELRKEGKGSSWLEKAIMTLEMRKRGVRWNNYSALKDEIIIVRNFKLK